MKKILVVDDDFSQRDLYFHLFKENGYDAVGASDGQEAWEKMQNEHFDLVFTGIMMPRLDGFALIEKIRQEGKFSGLPIVVFSHRGRDEDKQRAFNLGVGFMVKGYDTPKTILAKIRQILPDQTARPYTAGPAAPPSKPSVDDDPGPGITSI